MVALAKAYQDTDSSHSRTSRLRIRNRLRRNDCFWRKVDIAVYLTPNQLGLGLFESQAAPQPGHRELRITKQKFRQ